MPESATRSKYWQKHSDRVADLQGKSVQAHDWCCDAAFRWNQSYIVNLIPNERRLEILDVGCGNGLFTKPLVEKHHLCGLDFSEGMIEYACANGLDAQQGSAEELPHEDESFDTVLSIEMIQCVPDFTKAIGEMARVLKPGGKLVLQTLNRRSWLRSFHSLVEKNYRELHMFHSEELRDLAGAGGLAVKSVVYNFYPVPLFGEFRGLRLLAQAGATSLVLIAEKK
jgi:ubiquinone/menaquinone biosynthesis C-methylase UbiE